MKKPSEMLAVSLGIACLVLLLVGVGGLNSWQRSQQLESRTWVIHTYQVINKLEEVSTALAAAEAGQAEFILTGEKRYLQQFNNHSTHAEKLLSELRGLTYDNADQQHQLGLLASKLEEKRRRLQEVLSDPKERSAKIESLPLHLYDDEDIQKVLDEMHDSEQQLLHRRNEELAARTVGGNILMLLFLALSVGAVTTIGWFLRLYLLRRNALQTELNKRAAQLQMVLDTMSDGVVLADKDGQFLLFNPAAQLLIGPLVSMPPSQWSDHFGLFGSDQKTMFPSSELPLNRALRGESVDNVELYVRNPNIPSGRWILVTARPIGGAGQFFEGGIAVFRDITEKKEAERRVSEFYSTVSHELRTPLTSIRGSLGLIEGGVTEDITEIVELVQIARSESDRLIRLINDILDIRKLEAGKLELRKKTLQAETLVAQTIDNLRGFADDNHIELVTDISADGPIECDADRIVQVLTNFVSNAIKFSPDNTQVCVALKPGAGVFRFEVRDCGPGIAPDQMHKLFGMFQQLDQSDSKSHQSGTGLGLAISKAIVEEHGGTVGVESKVGEGSTFWFELPAVFTPGLIKADNETDGSGRFPALIVEDNQNLAILLKKELEMDGFVVQLASTIAQAKEELTKSAPGVVLLDLTLPDGNGLDLLSHLQSNERTAGVPVVVITGSTRDGQALGHPTLVDWVMKPFDKQRLDKALDKVRGTFGEARILLVEDDASTRKVLKEQLRSLGVNCLEAGTGVEAMKELRDSNPDLLILDLDIPAPNGAEIVRTLKEEDGARPLIVYTASDLTEEQKSRLTLGLTAHLTKSRTTPEELLSTVRQFLTKLVVEKRNRQGATPDGSTATDENNGTDTTNQNARSTEIIEKQRGS